MSIANKPDSEFSRATGGDVGSTKLIVGFEEVRVQDLALAGGKGANLGELAHVPGIQVPPGFIVTTGAYRRFLAENPGLTDYIHSHLDGLTTGTRDFVAAVSRAGSGIRNRIRSPQTAVPPDIQRELGAAYRTLVAKTGQEDVPVAVRSSASAEDLPDASFAGQQDTYLNVRGEPAVLEAVRNCWASLFTDRAISYRLEKGFDHFAVEIAVVVQQMIRSSKSGTAFNVDIETGWSGRHGTTRGVVYLEIGEGLGEAIVSGRQTPDKYLLAVSPTGRMVILDKRLGGKEVMIVYDDRPEGGTRTVPVPEELRGRFSITDDQAREIAGAVLAIADHYQDLRDIELAVDDRDRLWITQSRPETIFAGKSPGVIEQKKKVVRPEIARTAEVLFRGVPGSGAAWGRVVIIDATEPEALSAQMSRVKDGDILCAEFTTPDMVPAMKAAGGFITAVGGTTSHAAIVARELRKPAVVGVGKGFLDRLRLLQSEAAGRNEEPVVTVDANNGQVYGGWFPLEEVLVEIGDDVDLASLPVTRTKIGLIVANPAVARMFPIAGHPAHYGVSLMRAEFALAEIGVHPQALAAFDRGEFEPGGRLENRGRLRRAIIERLRGYSSGKQFYVETLARAIAAIAVTQAPDQIVIYRTTDFKTNEYREMLGGFLYEREEPNPMLGFRGEGRMIDPEYAGVFRWELEAVKAAREMGFGNVALMLPVVRTPGELQRALDFLAAEGLERGRDGLEIGIMVEVPYNALDLESFLLDAGDRTRVDFISIGSNDLTQFMLATGRDNDRMRSVFDETDPAVLRALEKVITTGRRLGVKTGLCGQRPSNDPAFAATLVGLGIESIGVADTTYVRVAQAVAAAEAAPQPAGPNAPAVGRGSAVSPSPAPPAKSPPLLEWPCRRLRAGQVLKNLGQHPLYFVRSVPEPELLYTREFFEEIVAAGGATPPDQVLVYSTNDLDPPAFRNLEGGAGFESPDDNPVMGFGGMVRLLHPEYEPFFRWELRALKQALERGVPVWLELTLVRTLQELDRALEILAEEGLAGLPVGLEVGTPANVLLADQFLRRGLYFISVDERRLAQYLLAADPANPKQLVPPAEIREALEKARGLVEDTAANLGLTLVRGTSLMPSESPEKEIHPHYPFRVPHRHKLNFHDRPVVRAEFAIRNREPRVTLQEGNLETHEQSILTRLLRHAVPFLLQYAPPCRSDCRFRLVITPELEWIAEADIENRSVYLHPCFFRLPEAEQIVILYHEIVSHIEHEEHDEREALRDTAAYIIQDGSRKWFKRGLLLKLLHEAFRQVYGPLIDVRVERVDVRELRPTHELDYGEPDLREKLTQVLENRIPLLLIWEQNARYILDGHGRAAVAYHLGKYHLDAIIIRPTGAIKNNPVEHMRCELRAFLHGIRRVADLKVRVTGGDRKIAN
ncbi:MAG: phosphoenolpyruvate synthase [Candidatus Desulforudis sp.]|nr:phosphoenolpyruvate synthase [Desulforudis sp.]